MGVHGRLEEGKGKPRKGLGDACESTASQRLLIAGLLCLCHLVSYADRFNISVAILHMSKEYGYSSTQQGYIFASFFVGYMMTQVLGGAASAPTAAFGPKAVLVSACAGWSLVAMATPACADHSLGMLFASRVLLGALEGLYIPAVMTMIAGWFPPHERASVNALGFVGMCLGAVSAMACAPYAAHNWRFLFYGFGTLGLIWAALFFVLGSDAPKAPKLNPEDYGAVEETPPPKPASYIKILSCPAFWAIAASHFAHNWSWYLTLSWLPKYFVQVWGMSEEAVGAHAMLPYAAAAVFCVSWARAMDSSLLRGWIDLWRARWYSQIFSAMVPISVWSVLVLLERSSTSGDGRWATLLLTMAVAAQTAAQSGFAPNIIDISGPENTGRVVAASNTLATLPGIFGNILVGVLLRDDVSGWTSVFCTMAVLHAIGLTVFTRFGQVTPLEL